MSLSVELNQQRLEQHFEQASINIRKLREHIIKIAQASGVEVFHVGESTTFEHVDLSGLPIKS